MALIQISIGFYYSAGKLSQKVNNHTKQNKLIESLKKSGKNIHRCLDIVTMKAKNMMRTVK